MYKLCKTEQSAARQRELERKLAEQMSICRYEEISVSDFCAFAGIPRKAFYRYFSSKDGALYALLDHTMLDYELFREPPAAVERKGLHGELESFFRFWKNHRQLLDALENSGLSGVLMERAISNVSAAAQEKKVLWNDNPRMRDHVIRFVVCGLMIMVVSWHKEGYQESPQQMAKLALKLISEPLIPVMKDLF